jgi:signal transduction histidine kinase
MSDSSEILKDNKGGSGKETGEGDSQAVFERLLENRSVLSGMSHEMRTQMNAIVAFSYLINNNNISISERQEFTDYIINSCEQLVSLFDNFFDTAIIETGNSVNDLRSCNLNQHVDKLMSELRSIAAKSGKVDIELIHDECSACSREVFVDSDKVSRVIRALFYIALDSTDSGYIRIGHIIDKGSALFHILDSGHGYEKNQEHSVPGNVFNFSVNSGDLKEQLYSIWQEGL